MRQKRMILRVGLVLTCCALLAIELAYYGRISQWGVNWSARLYGRQAYGIRAAAACVLGLLTALGLRRQISKGRPWLLLAAAVFLLAMWSLDQWKWRWLRELVLPLWPLFMGWLAMKLIDPMVWKGHCRMLLRIGLYDGLAVAGIALLMYHTVVWKRFEPAQTVALLLAANAGLWSTALRPSLFNRFQLLQEELTDPYRQKVPGRMACSIYIRTQLMNRNRVIGTAAVNAVVLGALCFQDRVEDILCGNVQAAGWLSYRWQALQANWQGNFFGMEEHFRDVIPLQCPLARIHELDGLPAALGVLALIVLAFVLMFGLLCTLPVRHRFAPLCRTLVWSLLLQSVLGFAADLLLVSSTEVHLLLLVQPWDVMPIVMLLILTWEDRKKDKEAKAVGFQKKTQSDAWRELEPPEQRAGAPAEGCQPQSRKELEGCAQRESS